MNTTPDPMENAPEWARHLSNRLDNIEKVHADVLRIVEEIKPEVMAVVEQMQANPMVRMLLGKGK